MKCPRCNFVASNKKDLCPRCEFDLRPKKRELSIPVLQPDAPIEQLIEQQRALASTSTKPVPEGPRVEIVQPKSTAVPFWKRLFGVKATAAEAPEKTQETHSPAPAPAPQKIEAKPAPAKPAPSSVENAKAEPEKDPLLFHLETLEREIAQTQVQTAEEHSAGLDFAPLPTSSSPSPFSAPGATTVPIVTMPASTPSFIPSPAPAPQPSGEMQLGNVAGTSGALADSDLQELISALDQLNEAESSSLITDSESDELFANPVSGIDASLDEIIHALDELNPDQELDDIELFETKFNDLAESMGSAVEAARSETEKLGEQDYGLGEIFETPEPEPVVEQIQTAEEPVERSQESEAHDLDTDVEVLNRLDDLFQEPSAQEPSSVSGRDEPEIAPRNAPDDLSDTPEQLELGPDEPSEEETALETADSSDAPTIEMDVIAQAEQPAEDAAPMPQPEEPEELFELPPVDTAAAPEMDLRTAGTPSVSPEVLHFGDEDENFEKTLDEMLGDTVVDVRAVKVEKKAAKPLPAVTTDDGMEISFELDFDGENLEPEAAPPELTRDPALDPILSDLLQSYETLEKNLQHHSIAPEGAPVVESAPHTDSADDHELPHLAFARKVMNAVPTAQRSERFEQLMKKLAFLSDDLIEELKEVYAYQARNPQPSSVTRPVAPPVVSVAPALLEPADELSALTAELGEELAALENEGLTIYSKESTDSEHADLPEPDGEIFVEEDENLAGLEAEFDREFAALKDEGLTVYSPQSTEHPVDADLSSGSAIQETIYEETLKTETLESHEQPQTPDEEYGKEADEQEELHALASDLDSELSGLYAEGTTLFAPHDETVEPTDTNAHESPSIVSGEDDLRAEVEALNERQPDGIDHNALAALESELDQEVASLEAEGTSLFHADSQVNFPEQPRELTHEPGESRAPVKIQYSELGAELDQEVASLEAEGTSLYHADSEVNDEEPSEELTHSPVEATPVEIEYSELEAELDQEVASLEAEGTSLYHADSQANLQEQLGEVTHEHVESGESPEIEYSELEAELDQEVASLEAEGTSLYHSDVEESDSLEVPPFTQLEAELDHELSQLQEQGMELVTAEYEAAHAGGDDEAVTPSETSIETPQAGVDQDLESLEGEDTTTLASESLQETPIAEAVYTDESIEALESELDHEVASLESEGTSLFHSESEEASSELDAASLAELESELAQEAAALNDAHVPFSEEEPQSAQDGAASDEETADAPDAEEAVEIQTAPEEADSDSVSEEAPEAPRGEELAQSVSTGSFLASDFARLIDIAADERADEPQDEPEHEPSKDGPAHDDREEISLAELAQFFNVNVTDEDSESEPGLFSHLNKPLDGAVSTGTFLLSDFQRILAQPAANVVIDPALWDAAEAEAAAHDRSGEVELDASALSAFQRNDAVDVLFDAAEEELADPKTARKRVAGVPVSDGKKVENSSLQAALTNFEREERVLSKRRAKFPGADHAAERAVEILRAPFLRRLTAGIIDIFLILVVSSAITWFGVLPARLHTVLLSLDGTHLDLVLPYCFRFAGLTYLLWLVMTAAFVSGWGQTVGGHVMNIETVTANGKVPDLKQAILRGLSHTTTAFTLGLGFVPLLKKKGWALHDTMSCTYPRAKK